LEEVTVALKRVAEKQRSEIERLRKQLAATSKAKDVASEAAANFAKAAAASAASSAANATAALGAHPPPVPGGGASAAALAMQEEKYHETAKALKQAKAEVKLLKDRIIALETPLPGTLTSGGGSGGGSDKASAAKIAAAESEVRRLDAEAKRAAAEAKSLKARCEALEKSLRDTGNAKQIPPALPVVSAAPLSTSSVDQTPIKSSVLMSSSSTQSNTGGGKTQQQSEKDAALGSTTNMAERAKSRIASSSSSDLEHTQQQSSLSSALTKAPGTAIASATSLSSSNDLRDRVSQLERENAELRSELSAFDLDFFEEIEDLKFKYAEAAKKCRAFDEYVRINPPRH
jgi:centrosomal protein CEP290